MNGIKKYLACLFIAAVSLTAAQVHTARITFERKTNLYKKFKKSPNVQDWLKEEDKIKIDFFELYITDTFSLFRPQTSELADNMEWATARNTVYQDFRTNQRYFIKPMWGEELHLTDSLWHRKWQITESTRRIAGYTCRKAFWRANDSVKIYAWFSYDLVPSTGPESFNGLPGTILGLATEDGGVVYFATKVELIRPEPALFVKPKKKKIYTVPELKEELTRRYGKEKWFPEMMGRQFGTW